MVPPAFSQYAGPAILSRGEAPAAMSVPTISFRPYIDITGVYDTGLAGVGLTDKGQLANTAAAGMELTGGVSGVHSWRHTKVGLDYQGSFRHYSQKTFYDGSDQALLLGITHAFTQHITLTMRESAGMYARNPGVLGLSQTATFDPNTAYIPTTDYFDNRTIYAATQADLIVQKSARLSFDLGGDGYLVRRRSTALYGVTSGVARADVQYRLSRHTTIGANYNYSHYGFTRVFGSTDMHTLSGSYSLRLSRWLEFSGFAGVARAETRFVQNVPVDPVVTALLGIVSGTQVIYHIRYVPNVEGRLSRTFQSGVAYISGGRTVTPGNGLFLTSAMTTVNGGYNYTGLRRWSFGANVLYSYGDSFGNVNGTYRSTAGTITASRQLAHSFHALASVSARNYGSADFHLYRRVVWEGRIGIGWAPGDLPMRLW
jgi:hypothetical protein